MLSESAISHIRKSWSRDTCYPKQREFWSHLNPALGQCAITAVLVSRLVGGEILFSKQNNHYWNRVEGQEIDLTREQFIGVVDLSDVIVVSEGSILKSGRANIRKRYEIFFEKFTYFNNPESIH